MRRVAIAGPAATAAAAAAAAVLGLFLSCSPSERFDPTFDQLSDLSSLPLPAVRISEIHYDNGSTDVGEAIEVSGPAGTDLTGWSIVLYNGTGGAVYDADALPTPIPATCGHRAHRSIVAARRGGCVDWAEHEHVRGVQRQRRTPPAPAATPAAASASGVRGRCRDPLRQRGRGRW